MEDLRGDINTLLWKAFYLFSIERGYISSCAHFLTASNELTVSKLNTFIPIYRAF